MCGIVGYVGDKPLVPLLIEGLKRLEYRGYDSAGFAIVSANQLVVEKQAGKISNLERILNGQNSAAQSASRTPAGQRTACRTMSMPTLTPTAKIASP